MEARKENGAMEAMEVRSQVPGTYDIFLQEVGI